MNARAGDSNRDFNRYGVNMLLYWEALKFSIESGCRVFDFGRSTRDYVRLSLAHPPTRPILFHSINVF